MVTKKPAHPVAVNNLWLAQQLEEVARLLQDQGANPFRIRAYKNAARTLRNLQDSAAEILKEHSLPGLIRLPGIGRSIAHALEQMIHSGKLTLLERLRGQNEPERIFATVADIGPKLAERIHEHLEIETLAELEAAAWDGRLAQVPGLGVKRLRAVRETLAGRLRRSPRADHTAPPPQPPRGTTVPIAELLDIDREYLHLVQLNRLPRIAPRRFNPGAAAWLPILHAQRGNRHYTAMFSNTARAHQLGTTRDWVVIYRDDHDDHGRWTAITSRFGGLKGRRIIRGREDECAAHYALESRKG